MSLPQISKDRAVILSTLGAARVSRLPAPAAGRPADPAWRTAEAHTVVTPQLEALDSGGIPLWVVVLAAVIGALLLLLLIFALYKVSWLSENRLNQPKDVQLGHHGIRFPKVMKRTALISYPGKHCPSQIARKRQAAHCICFSINFPFVFIF